MKPRLLDYLVCPRCHGSFTCQAEEERDGEIETGALLCSACGGSYPIVRGIPRILPESIAADKQRTADTFGWEWQQFQDLHPSWETYRDQFLDWIAPISPDFFRDKVVLDAGCGMGRFSLASARFEAKEVMAVDLSAAVEVAHKQTKGLPNVHVIQADLYHLPFARPFDFVFSIGVLHHLPDPEAGFMELARHVRTGGSLFAWVYGYENNQWIVRMVNPVRERVLSRLPRRFLYGIAFLMALGLQPVLKGLYRPGPLSGPWGALSRKLPYRGYLGWLAQYGLRHNHHVLFDHMAAPTAFYLRREEFEGWFRKASLQEVVISWRNENSWRGLGRVGHADPDPKL